MFACCSPRAGGGGGCDSMIFAASSIRLMYLTWLSLRKTVATLCPLRLDVEHHVLVGFRE